MGKQAEVVSERTWRNQEVIASVGPMPASLTFLYNVPIKKF